MGKTIPTFAFVAVGYLCGMASADAAPGEAPASAPQTCAASPRVPLSDADRALLRGDFAQAETLFAAMPATDASLAGQIRARLGQRQVPSALALAMQATAAFPHSAIVAGAMAAVRLARGEPVEALTNLRKAIALDPCSGRAHYDLSLFLDLSGMGASAQQELDAAYRLQPNDGVISRAWKTSQEPVPTPESQIADLRRIEARPAETDAQKAEIESLIASLEADKRGDCERVSPTAIATIPLVPLFGDGRQQPATGSAVDLVLNGKQRRMLLDTGATGMLISYEAAIGLGLTPEADVTSSGLGEGGASREYVAHLATMTIGNLEFRNCKIRVQRHPHGMDVPGLFGPDILNSLLLTFDFPRQALRTAALPALASAAAAKRDRSMPVGLENWTPALREGQSLLVPPLHWSS